MPVRLIPRLDIKAPHLVKGVRLEGLRVIGDPAEHAARYYEEGADELLYVDVVASLYGRSSIVDLVRRTAERVFIPLTVGGGVRTIDDVRTLLRAGADKVAINTAAIHSPKFIRSAAHTFGSQCVTVAIEAIRQPDGGWLAFTDNGRERTGVDAVAWAQRAVEMGAGELLLTSVDREGTGSGFEIPWIQQVAELVDVPVVACGGAGHREHLAEVADCGVDGIAVASLLHYRRRTIKEMKEALATAGAEVRL
ncbi:MAG: imidazole glycerol phosphate synthase cyclase subunit [Planctomycetota bacterium]